MPEVFLSPSRHTVLLTQRSQQCSETPSCRDCPAFPAKGSSGATRGFPYLKDVVSRSNSSISSNHRVPQHFLNNDVPQGGVLTPNYPHPQLFLRIFPVDFDGGGFSHKTGSLRKVCLWKFKTKSNTLTDFSFSQHPKIQTPGRFVLTVASGGKAAIRRPKVT